MNMATTNRIPTELQAVFLASNRGEVVDVPPRHGFASKVFDRWYNGKSHNKINFNTGINNRVDNSDVDALPKRNQRQQQQKSQQRKHSNNGFNKIFAPFRVSSSTAAVNVQIQPRQQTSSGRSSGTFATRNPEKAFDQEQVRNSDECDNVFDPSDGCSKKIPLHTTSTTNIIDETNTTNQEQTTIPKGLSKDSSVFSILSNIEYCQDESLVAGTIRSLSSLHETGSAEDNELRYRRLKHQTELVEKTTKVTSTAKRFFSWRNKKKSSYIPPATTAVASNRFLKSNKPFEEREKRRFQIPCEIVVYTSNANDDFHSKVPIEPILSDDFYWNDKTRSRSISPMAIQRESTTATKIMTFPQITINSNPQDYVDAIRSTRGYLNETYSALDLGYFTEVTPLQLTSYTSHMVKIVKNPDATDELGDLICSGISANPCNIHGESLLHIVCRLGYYDNLIMMIKCGAAIHVSDVNGRTPLHMTCWGAAYITTSPTVIDPPNIATSSSSTASSKSAEQRALLEPFFKTFDVLVSIDSSLLQITDRCNQTPLSYLQQSSQWSVWNEFLDTMTEKYFPVMEHDGIDDQALDVTTGSRLYMHLSRANANIGQDPTDALDLPLASLVANGKMNPDEAMALQQDLNLKRFDDIDRSEGRAYGNGETVESVGDDKNESEKEEESEEFSYDFSDSNTMKQHPNCANTHVSDLHTMVVSSSFRTRLGLVAASRDSLRSSGSSDDSDDQSSSESAVSDSDLASMSGTDAQQRNLNESNLVPPVHTDNDGQDSTCLKTIVGSNNRWDDTKSLASKSSTANNSNCRWNESLHSYTSQHSQNRWFEAPGKPNSRWDESQKSSYNRSKTISSRYKSISKSHLSIEPSKRSTKSEVATRSNANHNDSDLKLKQSNKNLPSSTTETINNSSKKIDEVLRCLELVQQQAHTTCS